MAAAAPAVEVAKPRDSVAARIVRVVGEGRR